MRQAASITAAELRTEPQFFVWVVHCEPWQPRHSHDVPPRGIVLEPAEPYCFSAAEARDYVSGFNASPERPRTLWAVSLPIRLRPDRELTPGTIFKSRARRQRPKSWVQ